MKANVNENNTHAKSQTDKILEWMLSGNTITPLEALNLFGCMRLGARIADIKKKGYIVYSEFVTTPSEKKVKRYHL
jgi:hypothetical protein